MILLQELIKQKKTLLLSILVLILLNVTLFAAHNNFIEPKLKSSEQHYDELRRRSVAEGAADVSTVYKRGVDDLKSLNSRIPIKRQFPQLLGDLMEMASSNSVRVGKMSYKPQLLKEDNLLAYSLALTVQGTYPAVKSFLVDLQAKHELLVIEQTHFANEDPYEESVSLEMNITLYFQNQEGV